MNNKKKNNNFNNYFFKIINIILRFVFITYQRIVRFFYNGKFSKKHIAFKLADGKMQITTVDHKDFINSTQKELDKLSINLERIKLIRIALERSVDGCNFIIFSSKNDENKFVQFWTENHQLKYNFYSCKTNKLEKYYLSVLGLLAEKGFVDSSNPEYKGRMTFKVKKREDYISVDANFRKDLNLAVEFTERIFRDIYKIRKNKLVVKVE